MPDSLANPVEASPDDRVQTAVERFAALGFVVLDDVLDAVTCTDLAALHGGGDDPGSRNLLASGACMALLARLRELPAVAALVPDDRVAVQCTSFEKSADTNWLVPVHQDLGIPVHERIDHPALSGWSRKEGGWYVQPPVDVLESLVALRVHLDDCGADDGPLRLVPGSHLLGRIDATDAPAVRTRLGEVIAVVPRGGLLVMRPLLLHASSKSCGTSRRRVLHFLFGPRALPFGLAWQRATDRD